MNSKNIIDIEAKEIFDKDTQNHSIETNMKINNNFEFKKYFDVNIKFIGKKIENILYDAPIFINTIKSILPKETLQAVLTDEQKEQIKKGVIEIVSKKDGSLIAQLRNSETKKIIANIELEKVKEFPELSKALNAYVEQKKMKQIAEEINNIRIAVEEVREGLENDRLALAYSCQQKLIQAMEMKSECLKNQALISVIHSAEDSRNLLMLSQNVNLRFISEQPENTIGKLINGAKQEEIDKRITEIRENLSALNITSLVSAIGYQVLGEEESMKMSLNYYRDYLDKAYFKSDGLIERLDSLDSLPENYWTKKVPSLKSSIDELPYNNLLIESNSENEIFYLEGE